MQRQLIAGEPRPSHREMSDPQCTDDRPIRQMGRLLINKLIGSLGQRSSDVSLQTPHRGQDDQGNPQDLTTESNVWGGTRVTALAWSPEGHMLGIGTSSGIAQYHSATLKLYCEVETSSPVISLELLDDTTAIVVAKDQIYLQSLQSSSLPKCSTPIPAPRVVTIASRSVLVAADHGDRVSIYLLGKEAPIATIQCMTIGLRGSIAFAPDESLLAIADGEVISLWNIADVATAQATLVRRIQSTAWGIGFVAQYPWIVSVLAHRVDIHHRESGDLVASLDCAYGTIERFAISCDGKIIALAGARGVQIAWIGRSQEHLLMPMTSSVLDLSFSPGGERLAIVGDGWLTVYSVGPGLSAQEQHTTSIEQIWGPMRGIAFMHGEATLLTLGRTCGAWAYPNQRLLRRFAPLPWHGPAAGVAVSPDNTLIAIATDRSTGVYRWSDGELLYTHDIGLARADSVAFCWERGDLVVVSENEVSIWDAWSGSPRHTIALATSDTDDLAIAPNGSTVALVYGRTIEVWSLYAEQREAVFEVDGHVNSVSLSKDGRFVAVATEYAIEIWDSVVGRCRSRLVAGAERVYFSPQMTYLVATRGAELDLWDLDTMIKRATFSGHLFAVSCVAFLDDERLMASASYDGTVRFWRCAALPDQAD